MARNCVLRHSKSLLVTYLLSRHQNFDLWENQKFWILKTIFSPNPQIKTHILLKSTFSVKNLLKTCFNRLGLSEKKFATLRRSLF